MRKSSLAVVALLLVGCHSRGLDRLLGTSENKHDPDGPPYTVAVTGELPASNALTFSPPFESTESIQSVRVRIAGTLTLISTAASSGPYYSFDGTTLTVFNYTAAGNQGTFTDNIDVLYVSPYQAGHHSVN